MLSVINMSVILDFVVLWIN